MAKYDLVIKGGTIIDGLQTPRYRRRHRHPSGKIVEIAAISPPMTPRSDRRCRARSSRPAVVDLHTHYDSQIFWDPWCTMSGWHGVTSVVIGNCGFGFAP